MCVIIITFFRTMQYAKMIEGVEPHVLLEVPKPQWWRGAYGPHQGGDREGVWLFRGLQESFRGHRRGTLRLRLGLARQDRRRRREGVGGGRGGFSGWRGGGFVWER